MAVDQYEHDLESLIVMVEGPVVSTIGMIFS